MKTDVLIIGGGPGGAATAMFLGSARNQADDPRTGNVSPLHIGESLTGEGGQASSAALLENEMVKREHPVKHGVRVFGTKRRH